MKIEEIYNKYEELNKKNHTVNLEEEKDENQRIKKIIITYTKDDSYGQYYDDVTEQYELDGNGNVVLMINKTQSDDMIYTDTNEYYLNGNLKKHTYNEFFVHGVDSVSEEEYDEDGNLIKKKEFDGIQEIDTEYDINKNTTKKIVKEYDEDGHIISENTEIEDDMPMLEEYDDEEYIDRLFEREKKAKEARDAGFEINEYGKIIRPVKQDSVTELENMSEEELKEIIENNNKTIENNNQVIKKSLVEEILNQQKTISEQQEEILKLKSQKKEL